MSWTTSACSAVILAAVAADTNTVRVALPQSGFADEAQRSMQTAAPIVPPRLDRRRVAPQEWVHPQSIGGADEHNFRRDVIRGGAGDK